MQVMRHTYWQKVTDQIQKDSSTAFIKYIQVTIKGELTNFLKFCYFFKSSILNAFL